MGMVESLFVAEKDLVESWIGKDVDFGEALGKHSEVEGTAERDDFTIISEDQSLIGKLEKIAKKHGLEGECIVLCGCSPLEARQMCAEIEEEEAEEEAEMEAESERDYLERKPLNRRI